MSIKLREKNYEFLCIEQEQHQQSEMTKSSSMAVFVSADLLCGGQIAAADGARQIVNMRTGAVMTVVCSARQV